MGTWDTGIFDNDDAADWVRELFEGDGAKLVRASLESAVRDSYLEAPVGIEALCAASVVATAVGVKTDGELPADVTRWLRTKAPAAQIRSLARLALHALDYVGGSRSELVDLWSEAPGGSVWREQLSELKRSLEMYLRQSSD